LKVSLISWGDMPGGMRKAVEGTAMVSSLYEAIESA
jgi:hypothetical protein